MNEWLWYLSRATALVGVVLLTSTFVLGTLTAGRAAPVAVPVFVRTALHRTLSLVAVTFIAAHVLTAIAETYVDIGWLSALIPFSSSYDRFWVGLGTLAVDLLIAVVATSLLRHRLPVRTWKLIHLASYACWPIALAAHGIGTSTTDGGLVVAVTIGCAVVGGAALIWRAGRTVADTDRRKLALTEVWR